MYKRPAESGGTKAPSPMPRYDFRTPRLYIDAPLEDGASIALDASQANYLGNVLRMKDGDPVLVFNGRNGEWRAALTSTGKRKLALVVGEQTRPQTSALDLHYLFAPLKHARLDYMVQKAIEMGASLLQPVITRHAQAARVNLERMRANAIEAAEQCGILTLPEIGAPLAFDRMIAARDPSRLLVFCDEDAEVKDPVAALAAARAALASEASGQRGDSIVRAHSASEDARERAGATRPEPGSSARSQQSKDPMPLAVLVGPEGGFAEDERAALLALPNTVRLALGPRILRADTAAVAALALVGAVLGDWRTPE
jgi:16S rRNA (uracil1498-N3)-methyltransferase